MTELQTFHQIHALREHLAQQRALGHRIAVVPTMGNLHAGHLALVTRALELADHVVATLFVNPMQFGANEDLEKYPRTLAADREKLIQAGCHSLFAPANEEIYPEGLAQHTVVSVPGLSTLHCGAGRPGHFDGVSTVVCKLFNIVAPDVAVFGLKDYQQFQLIRQMVRDLCLPIRIEGVATQRDANGLALSSRNGYLSPAQQQQAAAIQATLQQVAQHISNGQRDYRFLGDQGAQLLRQAGLEPEYFAVCHAQTLQPAGPDDRQLVLLAAARLEGTRLIDNLTLTVATP